MKPALYFFLFSWLFFAKKLQAQTDTLHLSLEEVVTLAQSDAPDALIAETQMKNSYWSYRTYLANYKPGITFSGTLPELNRSIGLITLPNGTSAFVQLSQLVNTAELSVLQRIAPTGGSVFLSSGLSRLDILNESATNNTSYFSTPISLGFFQPIFGYNDLKWDKRIQPLIYQEATREYAERMEEIAQNSSALFFDVFIAQLNLQAAQRDRANADTLYNISKGRFEVGRIAETELLQIELSAMNASAALQQALLDLQTGTEQLRNFLGLKQQVFFKLEAPTNIPDFNVTPEEALNYAKQFRSDVISFQRRLLVADANVAQAKADRGFQLNLSGQVSLSQKGNSLSEAYQSPEDNERFSLAVQIPIFDSGRGQARLETAYSAQELERRTVEQAQINFEQEIRLQVKQFDLQRNQVALALRAYEVAIKREEMTRNRYYIGKIEVLELNLAVSEKEAARRVYMNALRSFWLGYYDLRRNTLFDFERQVSLVKRVEGY